MCARGAALTPGISVPVDVGVRCAHGVVGRDAMAAVVIERRARQGLHGSAARGGVRKR